MKQLTNPSRSTGFPMSFCHSWCSGRSFFILAFLMLMQMTAFAESISRIEPPNWWAGMKNEAVQLLVYGEKIGDFNPSINYPGVRLEKVIKVENPNYLFLDLIIDASAKPGDVKIDFSKDGKLVESQNWPLWQRKHSGPEYKGFDNTDVMYLITPDRFANGDANNDEVKGMREKLNRSFKGGRHGGDIEGIRKHLDYIKDMGFTAIWLNPLLENDMEEYSYHGYSTTDFYKVDSRFGSNADYLQLADEARSKDIKLIMDMIVNHCGSFHWWMQDMPMADWINNYPNYAITNHKKWTLQDPHASEVDIKGFVDGWFVPTMPDLNQRNSMMATYLIQNSIWWVEYLGLAGIRMDTYPYPDMDFMTDWTRELMEEYPNLNIVGEEWVLKPAQVSYWQAGKQNANGYVSYLPSLMDFPLQSAMSRSLNAENGWEQLYETLSQDYLYPDPDNLVVFPDNHDMSRIFSQVNEDIALFKMANIYVATTRGIPQLYYGTEILMKNPGTDDHGIIRSDFPGGWKGDEVNGFTGKGLTAEQKDAQAFTKKLLNWRKSASVVHYGKMMHFIPQDNVYVYFRYNDKGKVMVILNKNTSPYQLKLDRFAEMLGGITEGTDALSGKTYSLTGPIDLPIRQGLILELK